MKINRVALLSLGVAAVCLVLSCGNRSSGQTSNETSVQEEVNSEDSQDDHPPVFNTTSLKQNTVSPAILYLDCSKSMAGYIEATNSSAFNSVIAGLLYRNDSSTAHLFDLKEQVGIPRDDFIEMLNNKRINWSSESNLGKMINAMAENYISGRADISYLITDGIMSGTDAQIRADREYNKTHYGYSQEEIESSLRKCGNDVAVLVAQYVSGFTTNPSKQFYYYCYDNSHVVLKEASRPFYIVALGTLDAIKRLKTDIEDNPRLSSFKNILLLGDGMPFLVDFKPAYNKGASLKGEELVDGKKTPIYAVDKGIKSSDPVFFNVNLSSLQEYMINEEYLKENGSVFLKSVSGSEYEMSQTNYTQSLTNGVLSIGIESEKLRGATLAYRIKYSLPAWISSSSSLDDKNISNELSPKTFNFRYFVDALAIVNKPHMDSNGYINQTDDIKFK